MGSPNRARISERGWCRPELWLQTVGSAPQSAAKRGRPCAQSERVLRIPEPSPASCPRPNQSPSAAVDRTRSPRGARSKAISHIAVPVGYTPRNAKQLVSPVVAAREGVNRDCGDERHDCPGGIRPGKCPAGPASVLSALESPGTPAPDQPGTAYGAVDSTANSFRAD
jgi:hypothetical protein